MIKHFFRRIVWVKAFEGVVSILDLFNLTATQRQIFIEALDVLRQIKP